MSDGADLILFIDLVSGSSLATMSYANFKFQAGEKSLPKLLEICWELRVLRQAAAQSTKHDVMG